MKTIALITFLAGCSLQLTAQYSGGTGTVGDPYQVATLTDLQTLSTTASDWNKHFIQTTDIDAQPTLTWNANSGFGCIGANPAGGGTAFTGSYNGAGFTISQLFVRRPTQDMQGLFGYVGSGSLIENVHLTEDSITGRDNVGALVGFFMGGTVTNCSTSGYVKGRYSTGGLAGGLAASTVTDCHSSGIVTSTQGTCGGLIGRGTALDVTRCFSSAQTSAVSGTVGGLIGWSEHSQLESCFAAGNVQSSGDAVGGLLGTTSYGSKTTNCYATGDVSGSAEVGGFCGFFSSVATPSVIDTVRNCYSIGKVTGVPSTTGGFAGTSAYNTYYSCYWSSEIPGNEQLNGIEFTEDTIGIFDRTIQELRTQSTFDSWDFTNVWQMGECSNKGFPIFQWQTVIPGVFPSSTVTNVNAVLTAVETQASYQWIDCATGDPIAGETNQSFAPAVNGEYAVIITKSQDCVDTSACITIDDLKTDANDLLQYSLYPNPTNGSFTVSLNNGDVPVEIHVYDMNGTSVYDGMITGASATVNLNVSGGIYFVKVTDQVNTVTDKLIVR